ncbi:MAG: phosphoribosylformylglycinamidine synthase subunit PurS [Deltaproteobacteria bacterium]|nr:phosphoribosylformylglycinamidine synthase subunit PurS [Deltaproteobacteria bacterium]
MKAQVIVKLKQGVLDPQGVAIGKSLSTLGFQGVNSVRQGKIFEIDLNASDEKSAKDELQKMSEKLLANPVIEDFEIKVSAS